MHRLLLASFSFLLLTACPPPVSDGEDDSGAITCGAICIGELIVRFADGRTDFQVQLTGDTLFSTLNLACPDNVAAGGPGDSGCLGDGFFVTADSYVFPETLDLKVDDADPVTLVPDWTQEELCGTTCSSAEVAVD